MQSLAAKVGPRPSAASATSRKGRTLVLACSSKSGNAISKVQRRELLLSGATILGGSSMFLGNPGQALAAAPDSIYSFSGTLDGQEFAFSQFKGKSQGFAIVAIPCNQFGGQAPGTDEQERQAAYRKFGRNDFPVLDHMLVNGPDAHPLYKYLKEQQPLSLPSSQGPVPGRKAGELEWNYVKFMINREGVPVKRFNPGFDPSEFEGDVRMLLAGKDPLPAECIAHPGRKVCNVDRLLQG